MTPFVLYSRQKRIIYSSRFLYFTTILFIEKLEEIKIGKAVSTIEINQKKTKILCSKVDLVFINRISFREHGTCFFITFNAVGVNFILIAFLFLFHCTKRSEQFLTKACANNKN